MQAVYTTVFHILNVTFIYLGEDPGYKSSVHYCVSHSQCNKAVGELCWWYYDGCSRGECICDPRTHYMDDSIGKCKPSEPLLTLFFTRTIL